MLNNIVIKEHLNEVTENMPKDLPRTLSSQLAEWLKPNETRGRQESLYLINTRLWMSQLSQKYHLPITIDTVPDTEWETLFEKYDIFWFMGIYVPSEASRDHAKIYVNQYRYALPDIDPEKDVAASPFAIPDYAPNPQIADSWETWDRMVDKLHAHGKKVVIDFVPNHTGLDHPWAKQHPEYYILGTEQQYQSNRDLFYPVRADDGKMYYIAHGKDPNYPEWADTLQLNYATAEVQEEMGKIMLKLVEHADGIRCDMAMLVNPTTFLRTWGWILTNEQQNYLQQNYFWRKKIPLAKEKAESMGREFNFYGEIYWDKGAMGEDFDGMYDNDLYEILREVGAGGNLQRLRDHLNYLLKRQNSQRCRDILYIENHDEPRALHMLGRFSKACAVLVGIIPGSIFMVNQGQAEGCQIRPPMQINHFPEEAVDTDTVEFYAKLLAFSRCRLFQQGIWELPSIDDRNVVALKVRSPDGAVCAVICINPCNYDVNCTFPEIDQKTNVMVTSLTDPRDITADQIRSNGIYIALKPYEVQVVFFSKV